MLPWVKNSLLPLITFTFEIYRWALIICESASSPNMALFNIYDYYTLIDEVHCFLRQEVHV